MARQPANIEVPDYYDLVSAIWILSSNDENPIVTNAGVIDRLALPADYDLNKIIRSRRELFRPGISASRLERWKAQLRAGRGLPGWLQEISDQSARNQRIEEISAADVFRNQFRTTENSPRCDLSVIDWGLQHIERLRKAALDVRNERRQRWSTLFIPAGSLILAALSLIGSLYVQTLIANSQILTKQYEVTLKPKEDGYSRYMTSLYEAYSRAVHKDSDRMYTAIMEIENAYFAVEPFLDERERVSLWDRGAAV
jgi:hypothetical protein